jgi:hypothetical protein
MPDRTLLPSGWDHQEILALLHPRSHLRRRAIAIGWIGAPAETQHLSDLPRIDGMMPCHSIVGIRHHPYSQPERTAIALGPEMPGRSPPLQQCRKVPPLMKHIEIGILTQRCPIPFLLISHRPRTDFLQLLRLDLLCMIQVPSQL